MHYTHIACITIDSVMRIDEKTIRKFIKKSVNIEQKKIQMSRFINTELESESDSESDSEAESKSDTKLKAILESNSDSDSE